MFLDFDGTLVDLAPTPDGLVVEPGLPLLLERLERRLGGAMAIVSGRPLADIDARLGLPGLCVRHPRLRIERKPGALALQRAMRSFRIRLAS